MELRSVCFIHEANIYQALEIHTGLCLAQRELSADGIQDHTVMGKMNWNGSSVPLHRVQIPYPTNLQVFKTMNLREGRRASGNRRQRKGKRK